MNRLIFQKGQPYERKYTDQNGESVYQVFQKGREYQFTGLMEEGTPLDLYSSEQIEEKYEDLFEETFVFSPQSLKTKVFVDRFFKGYSYQDLAEKYETSEDNVAKYYSNAVNRIFEVLEALDDQDMSLRRYNMAQSKIKNLKEINPNIKYFLLRELFLLSPREISEMVGISHGSVRNALTNAKKTFKDHPERVVQEFQNAMNA